MVGFPEETHNLSILNARPSLVAGPDLLHHLVAPSSGAAAIDFLENGSKRRTFSYEALHILSDRLAQRITDSLVKLENASPIIPVILPQCPELYIALLAISKAGKAFCPLNLDVPAERLNFILKDISAGLMITNSTVSESLRLPSGLSTLQVDQELLRQDSRTPSLPTGSTDDLAYVLYTSGSTGLPKAVSVSHRAVTQSLLAHNRHIPSFSRFLQFAAPTFDVSIFEIFFPWYRGATLVGRVRSEMLDNLPHTIHTLSVDAVELTPTVVSNLLNGRSSVPSLKLLMTIGEMLTPDVVGEYGGTETRESILWAMYGPTEAAIHCTLQPHLSVSAPTSSIGYPLDSVSAFIVAPALGGDPTTAFTILPVEEEGELAVGGYQIAREYLNRPELTATSFMRHPIYGDVYRTGDRAKLRRDGTLECLGRIVSGQVKLRGQRVELGEVEQIILKTRDVRATTVLVIDEVLVAFCAIGSAAVQSSDVLQMCKRWLPDVMVPSHVLFVRCMPQLPSGKIDKASLNRLYHANSNGHGPAQAHGDVTANHPILTIFESELNQHFTLNSNLINSGLSSLQAIKLASQLRAKGYDVSTAQLLSTNTIADLLRAASGRQKQANGELRQDTSFLNTDPKEYPALRRWWTEISFTLPCTQLQEAMLTETVIRPSAYCNWVEVDLAGAYTFEEISKAIHQLAQLNEILRTGFYAGSQHGGTFLQIVWAGVDSSQLRQVNEFSKQFSLGSPESLLRPLSVQVRTRGETSKLLLQIHHALYDGWSLDLVLEDLNSILHGRPTARRPQFREVVRHYEEVRASSQENAMKFWSELLSDRADVSLPNYNGKMIEGQPTRCWRGRSAVDPHKLWQRSRELNLSPQVFYQTALAFVLSLYTNSEDVVIGNVTSGRSIPVTGIEDIIGPCIASLPFRLRFQGLNDAQSALREAQRLNYASLEHATLPLRTIAKAANVRPGTRMFDVLFVWQQPLHSIASEKGNCCVLDSADDLECKLTFEVEPRSDCISFRATFDPTTLPEAQVKYLSQQIDDVVDLFLDDVYCPTSEISKCFSARTQSIANPIPVNMSAEHGPSHVVEKWALRTPHNEAINFGAIGKSGMQITGTVTYAELNKSANQLAHYLAGRGVRPGQLVGVIMEKSIGLYTSILAVLKLGAGYLPLVPDLPRERINTILRNAQVEVCICDTSSSPRLRQDSSPITVDFDAVDLLAYSNQNLGIPYDGTRVAYAVFTSGSTGTPKGVLVTQENLMSNLEYLSTIYPFTAQSRLLQACSQAFDVSVFEIFFAWNVGICLCAAAKDDVLLDIENAINNLGVTHLSLTPTVAALVDPDKVPCVEFLVTAGEAVTEHVRRTWAGRGLYQGYGPSETTNICTVRPSVSTTDLINNIGRPFSNTSAFVIHPNDNTILPRGAVGELCFGGYQVFKGYLRQPDLTAAKIIQHPQYGRIYRSGDLGILLEDDSILFKGRIDDQVKIRGQRVELGEITSVLLEKGIVRDCAALLITTQGSTSRLVVFWVPVENETAKFRALDPRTLRTIIMDMFATLADRLPSYMVPSHLIPVSRLPMTAQGKIDKRRLQQCYTDLDQTFLDNATYCRDDADDVEMNDEWESQARDVLAETLQIDPGSVHRSSSFFTLGLDSVLAISFSNMLRKSGLGSLTVPTILKHPTIALLATAKPMDSVPNPTRTRPTEAFSPTEISRIRTLLGERSQNCKIRPCTPLQEAMLSSGVSSSRSSYTNAMLFSVHGDLRKLQDAWALIVDRHEILRTSFVATNDPSYAWAQVTQENTITSWDTFDVSMDWRQLADQTILKLMSANRPPIWLAIASQQHTCSLLFCCHHALYDGIAIQTLLFEVQEACLSRKLLPPIPYDLYLQQMLSQDLSLADDFWIASFKDFEPSPFPDLTGKPQTSIHAPATLHTQLRVPLGDISRSCQRASLSLLSVVQATWAKLLQFYTGESDVCFGNVVSGRALTDLDLNRLVAPCFNTLPVRVSFNSHQKHRALAEQLQAFNIDSLGYQLTPLRRIQNLVVQDGRKLFDTLVILQQPSEPLNENIWTLQDESGDMDLPLVCEVIQNSVEDRLEVALHYSNSIATAAEAKIIADTFQCCLEDILGYPDALVGDWISLESQHRSESNLEYARDESETILLHHGFESNAQSSPEQIALDFVHADRSRTTWSYKELNERANHIARALIDSNVRPEDIVPIHLAKSPLFYASVLGVLKAGAAFAPIHPGLPEARKTVMLEQLGSKLVLSTKECSNYEFCSSLSVLFVEDLPHNGTETVPSIPQINTTNLAYCLFTSGSTGTPKAVSVEHRSPVQTIKSSRPLVPWDPSSRLLQYAAVTFDMCFYDCFLAWSFGFTLCAAEQQLMLDELPDVINSLDIDLLDLTPTVAATLTRSEVPKVKWLYCIGEAMTPGIIATWGEACVNSYGPTEAAFCTTMHTVSKETKTAVIGKPFQSTSFAVFGPKGDRPLPMLSVGELYIGGAQLARGYLGAHGLTEAKFVSKCGQRFYRSGDMVRMLSDGNFEFLGRADDQVKIRGLRVELGEINHTLQHAHDDVESVVTQILKTSAAAKEQLVAFLVVDRFYDVIMRKELQDHLRQKARNTLPAYMVPHFFVFIDSVPRSLAGKIDKKTLTELFQRSLEGTEEIDLRSYQDESHRWTETESHIREILAQLSRTAVQEVSPTTTIYQLGLDSISAVQIAATLRRRGYELNSADIMKFLTCVDIAAHINQARTIRGQSVEQFDFASFDTANRPHVLATPDLANQHVAAIRPCTPLQKGMLSQMLAKEGSVYINYLRMRLPPNVDVGRLRQAWQQAMEMYCMLRTGFAHLPQREHPFAMIEYKPDAFALPWNVLIDDNVVEAANRWVDTIRKGAVANLHRPLWHIRIVPDNDTLSLDLAIFHGLFDAQSLQTILQNVGASYYGQHSQPAVSINPVIDGILQWADDRDTPGRQFWADMGKQAVPCRFPNLSPLREDVEPPITCKFRSAANLHDLDRACRQSNTTMQAVGLASWLSIIAAYTGEPAATCGIVLSGRTSEAAEKAVFPCINTVPFTCTLAAEDRQTVKIVTKSLADVQQYQHVPLSITQKLMDHPNEALFDSIFAYQKLPSQDTEHDIWKVVDEEATIEYPVSIELEPIEDYLEYRLTVMPHVIPREQANTMLKQLDHLVERLLSLTASCETIDGSLYAITPAKEATLPSKTRLLHEFVEHSAKQYPERIALEFADSIDKGRCSSRRWTYRELDIEGNRVAHLLIANGVQSGTLVGICFDKCPEASFAILGILKAGCAFVAIDPGAPAARQVFVTRDSGASAVLSMSAQSAKLSKDVTVPVLNLDITTSHALPGTPVVLGKGIDLQDRSYCLYTSGTTGTPKGCELTHENAVQALLSFQRIFAGHWDATSRWLQFASFHFDVSVLEQYWSWSVGICVVSAPRDVIFEDLANSISTLGITHIDLTPSLAQLVHPESVPSLCRGVFITGGESLKQEILDVWGPKAVIYNGYGPTEATIGCTMYPRVPADGKPSNIGWQFDNVGTMVLKPGSDVPVLRGGVGELCVSGKLVGKGYLNRPDLTEKSFPYLERFQERVYRTGDLVRVLHDGTFDFLGRADDQVKLRGQRLEIGEINSVIRQSDQQITDVATLVLKHPQQQKDQLVSFIVHSRGKGEPSIVMGGQFDTSKAKEACHEKLPPYMVPTHVICLTTLPLNINNKADAKRLKEMYNALSAADLHNITLSSNENSQTWSTQEQQLREVVANELDLACDIVGKDTSFFELGMDSISVIGFVRALKLAKFHNATASLVMAYPTVRRLAKATSADASATSTRASLLAAKQAISATQHRYRRVVAQTVGISTSDIEVLAPCTPLQQGMIAKYLDSDNGLYFNTFHFVLSNEVDLRRLQSAWKIVFETFPILRTMFINTQDGYVQAAGNNLNLPWTLETTVKHESRNACLARLRRKWLETNRQNFVRPFELIHVSDSRQQLLVVHMFHGLYDGISIELIFKAVWDAYNERTFCSDQPDFFTALAHGPLQVAKGAKDFWQKHFSSSLSHEMPSLVTNSSDEPVRVVRELGDLEWLEAVRRKLNVTAQAIAQACWLHALQKHTASAPTVGIVVSGRSIDLESSDHIIGPMFNTIPYQHHPIRGETWASYIRRVHNFNVAAHPYQHTALRDIAKWCRTNQRQPLFDTLFVYQVAAGGMREWSDNEIWNLEDGEVVADYPLAFEVEQGMINNWTLTLVAQGHIADVTALNRLLNNFEEGLRQALQDPTMIVDATTITNGHATTFTNGHSSNGHLNGEHQSNGLYRMSDFEWTDTAKILREALAALTGSDVDDIKETTTIFELGLDSIDAIKLSSKLKKQNLDLAVSKIMRGLTIAGMLSSVSYVGGQTQDQDSTTAIFETLQAKFRGYLEGQNTDLGQIEAVLPLTPLQEGMTAEMVSSGFTKYYNFDVMELNTNTDKDRLRDAWTQVVEASPILRTSLIEIDDPEIESSFAQVVRSQSHGFWSHATIDEEPDFMAVFEDLRNEAVRSSTVEPYFCVLLLDAQDKSYIILAIAHALYDGWSLGLIHADVASAYTGCLTNRPDYQLTLSAILSASGTHAAAFWGDYLFEAKASKFLSKPKVQENPVTVIHRLERRSAVAAHDATNFAKKSNVAIQTLGQTVFAMVLSSYVHSLDVSFGSILSGRDDETTSKLMFPTMNTVAIRTILHGSRLDLLHHVQDSFMSVKQYQHFPLRKALALAGAHGGLFESLFIYQKRVETNDKDSQSLYSSVTGYSDVEYPVCVEMEMIKSELTWRCAVKSDVFAESDAMEMLARLDGVLQEVMQNPDGAVINFSSEGHSVCGLPPFKDAKEGTPILANESLGLQDPISEFQEQAIHIIRQVLASVSGMQEDDITYDTTIFHIGLDSISAIKVSSLLRKKNIILGVGDMLRAGTVSAMARLLETRQDEKVEVDLGHELSIDNIVHNVGREVIKKQAMLAGVPFAEIEELQVQPVTAGQQYMLSMWLRTMGGNMYNQFEYTITGRSISMDELNNVWRALVAANPILRTYFIATSSGQTPYLQMVGKANSHKVWDEITPSQASKPSDISQPWARLLRTRVSNGSCTLKLRIHHALYDGVSLPILIQQLQNLCNGGVAPSLDTAFTKLVLKQSTSAAIEKRKTFWTRYLSGVKQNYLPQPASTPLERLEMFHPSWLSSAPLEKAARENGVSLHALFLAAYAKLYAALTYSPETADVIIGVYLANRSHDTTVRNAAIPTVNLLPLRVHRPSRHAQDILASARVIQRDLQEISAPGNAWSSLYEISEWSGVKVDTFVNFLTLPDSDAEEMQTNEEHVRIVPAQASGWLEPRCEVVERSARFTSDDEDMLEKYLMNERVNKTYLHAVDIEVALRNGALDVGVFAPTEMLSMGEGAELINGLRGHLTSFEDVER
ncbi:hypothetical protein FB567DRAFT_215680 [Paraphoma chrysanthemicola]|uniref:Carrier domain-containing protein n=1 Tax=Paraphoma chrysanthemicola TaxID=798071 RepID=A0A8K0QTC5_9PLEO|nr:hypothetical protein FB567DRAFT_215680 [Paraphoma chrysanthemicola]